MSRSTKTKSKPDPEPEPLLSDKERFLLRAKLAGSILPGMVQADMVRRSLNPHELLADQLAAAAVRLADRTLAELEKQLQPSTY